MLTNPFPAVIPGEAVLYDKGSGLFDFVGADISEYRPEYPYEPGDECYGMSYWTIVPPRDWERRVGGRWRKVRIVIVSLDENDEPQYSYLYCRPFGSASVVDADDCVIEEVMPAPAVTYQDIIMPATTGSRSITVYAENLPDVCLSGTATITIDVIPCACQECPVDPILTSVEVDDFTGTAFSGAGQVTGVTFPSGITSISNQAFFQCTSLTSVDIPSGVTNIGTQAFQGCTSLASIDIPSTVTSIGISAFNSCTSLASISIPSGVTNIANQMFYGCTSLTSVDIPSGVTNIGTQAFQGCIALTSVDIPSGVTNIGNQAFLNCYSLSSVDIPSSVTELGTSAFMNCIALTSVDIPSGVTKLGNSAFQSCSSLTSVDLSSTVTSIGSGAFGSCAALNSVTVRATTPPTAYSNTFPNNANLVIYVPAESVETYKAASGWSTYADKIQAIP